MLQARTGVEALKVFDDTVDLLLTDVRMPYLGGDVLLKQLRVKRPSLRVLVFSGYTNHAISDDVPFLMKPFSRQQLQEAITRVLADQTAL